MVMALKKEPISHEAIMHQQEEVKVGLCISSIKGPKTLGFPSNSIKNCKKLCHQQAEMKASLRF